MEIQRLPLAERLQDCKNGRTGYPEYIPCVIRQLAEMPVLDYLGGMHLKWKCRFIDLLAFGASNPSYQCAAQKIRRLYQTEPKAAAEAMRILAAPMRHYQDVLENAPVYEETDFTEGWGETPVPAYRVEKLPLGERIRRAAARQREGAFLHIYRLYAESFFGWMDALLDSGSTYSDIYDNMEAALGAELLLCLKEGEDSCPLPTLIEASRRFPEEDETRVLYQTLICPFADLCEKEQKET